MSLFTGTILLSRFSSLRSLKRTIAFSSKNDGLEENVPGVNEESDKMKDTTHLDEDKNSLSVEEAA